MSYLYLKALHIIFVVTWFAGLFYMPRLMVYAIEAQQNPDETVKNALLSHLLLWQKRLWLGITTPSAVLTLIFGFSLFYHFYPDVPQWLWIKMGFLVVLYAYHIATHRLFRQHQNRIFKQTSDQMRLWNEAPTLLLFAIVFQVILKDNFTFLGLAGVLAGLAAVIFLGFWVYRKFRLKK